MKVNFFLFSIIAIALLIYGCITVDQYGRPIDISEKKSGKVRLQDIPIRPTWSDQDLRIPVIIAGLPDRAPLIKVIANIPPVGNQGGQPSGSAWASGYTAMSLLMRQKGNHDFVCSPAFIYNQLNAGNNGIEVLDSLKLLSEAGCPHQKKMPYDHLDSNSRPDSAAFADASKYKIDGFGRVDFTDVDQMRAHLLQGSVVMAVIRVTRNFLNLSDSAFKIPEGLFIARHTVAVVGYNHSKRSFLIQNSAGNDWGNDGYVEIPYNWFIRLCSQAYILW